MESRFLITGAGAMLKPAMQVGEQDNRRGIIVVRVDRISELTSPRFGLGRE